MNNSLQQHQQQSYNDKYSKETWISQYRNVKPSRILLQQKTVYEWWCQPDEQSSQSNHYTNIWTLIILQARCPSSRQTKSV